MPSWNQLTDEFDRFMAKNSRDGGKWFNNRQINSLQAISKLRGNSNVIFYASGWMQKKQARLANVAIIDEDINGFMAVMHGIDKSSKKLTLLLHTPGGSVDAAETIVEYLRSKFDFIEVIVPAAAMSAGTMISLASNNIVMGRQSQLGPTDPFIENTSAHSIISEFEAAKKAITKNPENIGYANLWAPILSNLGFGRLHEAKEAQKHSQSIVTQWLAQWMFGEKSKKIALQKAKKAAGYFTNAGKHKSHGKRIDREDASRQELTIESLEENQDLQEAVLTAYHIAVMIFERTPTTKFIANHAGNRWIKLEQS